VDEAIVQCEAVVKIHVAAAGRVQALRGVDLSVRRGELLALVGPSGSGKSSLLRIIAGLDEATAGRVRVDGVDFATVGRRRRRLVRSRLLSHVHQRPGDNLVPHLSAIEHVERVVARRKGDPAAAVEMLTRVGLAHRGEHRPHELSGGEQQRLAFARAAVGAPSLVIADEPTAELDRANTAAVAAVIADLNAAGTTVVVATHDPDLLVGIDRVAVLRDGALASLRQGAREFAAIDVSGRVQLPPSLRDRFPDGTVELGWDDDGDQLTGRRP
jgi:putative ABC transport system ATP-binding protein